MDDCPVGADRLEVIDSGSSERLFSAMRDQAERGRDFRRRVRWMWLRRELVIRPEDATVIDLRGDGELGSGVAPGPGVELSSSQAPEGPLQQESA